MSTVDRSFIGAGSIHIQPYDQSAPLLPIGNISEFTFSFEEDRIRAQLFYQPLLTDKARIAGTMLDFPNNSRVTQAQLAGERGRERVVARVRNHEKPIGRRGNGHPFSPT